MAAGSQPEAADTGKYLFEGFELDLRSGILSTGGERVPLQDLPLRLLGILVKRQGEVVTRAELQGELWPGKSFLDFEAGLNTAIRKLRQALQDDPRQPHIIGTTRGYGYRMLAPVIVLAPPEPPAMVEAAADSAKAGPATAPADRGRVRRHRTLVPVLVTLGLSALWLLWWVTPLPPPTVTRILPITTSGALDYALRPPSDGSRVYYIERHGDGWQAMQTSVIGGEPQPIATPFPNMAILDINLDAGRLLAGVIESRGQPLTLWTLPVQGGPPQRLGNLEALSATWSHDGQALLFTLRNQLWIANADGTQPRVVLTMPDVVDWPVWSPDDQRFRFVMAQSLEGGMTMWEANRDGANVHQLLRGWTNPPFDGRGSWSPDGRYFFFASRHDGAVDLWAMREQHDWLRRSPSGPFRLTSGPMVAESASMNADGKRVYFFGASTRQITQILDAHHTLNPLLPGLEILGPSYSQDGQWLTYVDANGAMWRSRADGSERRRLAPATLAAWFPRWSPDGGSVAFSGQYLGQPAGAYVVARDGGALKPLAPQWLDVRDPDWSPDGKFIAVTHLADPRQPTGEHRLALVSTATLQGADLPGSDHLIGPRWSPDGKYLAATSEDQHQIAVLDLAAHRWRVVAQGKAIGIGVWAPSGDGLYFQDLLGAGEAVQLARAPDWAPAAVAEFSAAFRAGAQRCALVGVQPDGRVLMMSTIASSNLYAAEVNLP